MTDGDRFDAAVAYAKKLGAEHGKNAAEWWEQDAIGGRTTGDPRPTAERVLRGIEDGDPLILDGLPSPDLSGEWADTLTGPQLVLDAMEAAGIDPQEDDEDGEIFAAWFGEICDEYSYAFADAAQDEVGRLCRGVLEAV